MDEGIAVLLCILCFAVYLFCLDRLTRGLKEYRGETISADINNESPARTVPLKIHFGIILKWTIATFIGWLAALSLASIPGLSAVVDSSLSFYPYFLVGGYRIVILFGFMGLLSSLLQAWLLNKYLNHSFYWAIATMVGALLGGIFMISAVPTNSFEWLGYPLFTIIPVSLAQGIVLGFLFSRFSTGCIWAILRFFLGFFAFANYRLFSSYYWNGKHSSPGLFPLHRDWPTFWIFKWAFYRW